jgi:hypothetical protein
MTDRLAYGLGSERVEALELLGLDALADAAAIKQAYRRGAVAHPPDTDPEGFRKVRAAYERASDPWREARERLFDRSCHAKPPALAEHEPTERHALALSLLRAVVARLDSRLLLPDDHEGVPGRAK